MNIEKTLNIELQQETIRFSYSLSSEDDAINYSVLKKPFTATEDEIFRLFALGINSSIFSSVLQAGLKTVIRNTLPLPVPTRALSQGGLCDIYAVGEVIKGDSKIAIERIFCQGINLFKLRWGLYQKNPRGYYALVQQPLDITEEATVYLFQKAIEQGVFTQVFLAALMTVL